MAEPLIYPPTLKPGDLVRIVSPASPVAQEGVRVGADLFASWGLEVQLGAHVFNQHGGFLAGTDVDRASDFNDGVRDPGVRAIFASRGGKGAYRLVELLDYDAMRADPKLVVGFSEITILHLAFLARARVPGVHGPMANWNFAFCGADSAELLQRAVMSADAVQLRSDPSESTSVLTTQGTARGPLVGGNLDMVRTAYGSYLPDLSGAILVLEDPVDEQIGRVDRSLHQLRVAGVLDNVAAVAVGQFGEVKPRPRRWMVTDVLSDQLRRLGVPILGGLRIGHGLHPATVPVGPMATLDADAGTLTVESATR